jgi:hypothetical protein
MFMVAGSRNAGRHIGAQSLPTSMPAERSLTSSWKESALHFFGLFGPHNARMRAIIVFIHFTSMIGMIFR